MVSVYPHNPKHPIGPAEEAPEWMPTLRHVAAWEVRELESTGSSAQDWQNVMVGHDFVPKFIRSCVFSGLVRLAGFESVHLEAEGIILPAGLYNSRISSCDFGHNAAVHDVAYLDGYTLEDECVLLNIGEMIGKSAATSKNESNLHRPWINAWNENGGRKILAFESMRTSDAYIWARYRDDAALQEKLMQFTDRIYAESMCGGVVGKRASVRNTKIIHDARIGSHSVINGANRLSNITIRGRETSPTHIGAGVELVDGIVGVGCRVESGAKAERFLLGENCTVKNGARLIDVVLGDNSTVACCEVLNCLIFPAHEQHHNNSFLIASMVGGQSNIAAGATIGSNHNSRAADGEIIAGRGFWPGLCASLKHNSRFASFVLIAKGAYPAELDIPFPFSLVSNNEAENCLEVIPAFSFLYNMYAVIRNSAKFAARDKRMERAQKIEFDYLAPDTIEEMRKAVALLEKWIAKARETNANAGAKADAARLEVSGEGMENSHRKVRVCKAEAACAAYREMIEYYCVRTLAEWLSSDASNDPRLLEQIALEPDLHAWQNVGGQIVNARDRENILGKIKGGEIASWQALHEELDRLWDEYPRTKAAHALGLLSEAGRDASSPCPSVPVDVYTRQHFQWRDIAERAIKTQWKIAQLVHGSRAKDYENPFRMITFEGREEMEAVIGKLEENEFIAQVRKDSERFEKMVRETMLEEE